MKSMGFPSQTGHFLATWNWIFYLWVFISSLSNILFYLLSKSNVKPLQGDVYASALRAEKSNTNMRYYTLLFLLAVSYWAVQGTAMFQEIKISTLHLNEKQPSQNCKALLLTSLLGGKCLLLNHQHHHFLHWELYLMMNHPRSDRASPLPRLRKLKLVIAFVFRWDKNKN